MPRLDGKVALVTGAASGIGKQIARVFKEAGAAVVASDLRDPQMEGFTCVTHDVTDEAAWKTVLDHTKKKLGRLDILINCAGIGGLMEPQDAAHCTLEHWRKIFAVNVEGVFLGCRMVAPYLLEEGSGSIVNISSLAGRIGTPLAVAYGASKAAVSHLTKSVAMYLAHKNPGIRCNAIAPGAIETPIWDPFLGQGKERESRMQAMTKAVPMKAFGQPTDVASAALFLASEEARYITGTELLVDGGMSAGGGS